MNDPDIRMLIERMNNSIDGQKKMEGKLDMIVQMQLTMATLQEQVRTLQSGQQRLFEKSDDAEQRIDKLREDDITPLRDDMIGNRRAIRVLSAISTVVIGLAGTAYTQWKPWQGDIAAAKAARDDQLAKYSADIGRELQADDRRLTVLEFRANNLDGKKTK